MNETMNDNTEENLVKPVLDNLGRSYATGKRKNAVAREHQCLETISLFDALSSSYTDLCTIRCH